LKQFRFKAVVSLDRSGQQPPGGQYPSGTHSLMVRAPCRDQPGLRKYFPAVIFRDDEQPLSPGDTGVIVTIRIADDDAPNFFCPGQPIALWNGGDVGHGTVSRRVFLS
jgi:hypothetical protein